MIPDANNVYGHVVAQRGLGPVLIEMANEQLGGMMRGLVLVSNTGEVAQRPVEGHSPVGDRGRAGAREG